MTRRRRVPRTAGLNKAIPPHDGRMDSYSYRPIPPIVKWNQWNQGFLRYDNGAIRQNPTTRDYERPARLSARLAYSAFARAQPGGPTEPPTGHRSRMAQHWEPSDAPGAAKKRGPVWIVPTLRAWYPM